VLLCLNLFHKNEHGWLFRNYKQSRWRAIQYKFKASNLVLVLYPAVVMLMMDIVQKVLQGQKCVDLSGWRNESHCYPVLEICCQTAFLFDWSTRRLKTDKNVNVSEYSLVEWILRVLESKCIVSLLQRWLYLYLWYIFIAQSECYCLWWFQLLSNRLLSCLSCAQCLALSGWPAMSSMTSLGFWHLCPSHSMPMSNRGPHVAPVAILPHTLLAHSSNSVSWKTHHSLSNT
jgi:hypothetical protein